MNTTKNQPLKEIHNQNSRGHFKIRSMTQYSAMDQKSNKLSQDQLKKLAFKDNKKPSRFISGTISNSKAMIIQQPPIYQNFQLQKQMVSQRKQLENLRLQEDSQDTKLMKIQQQERKVNELYTKEKDLMETKLTQLAQEAQKHHDEQNQANKILEETQKEKVQRNDIKIQNLREKKQRDQMKNQKLRQEIQDYQNKIQDQDREMEQLVKEIAETKKYENFLASVTPHFAESQTQGDIYIIQLFDQLENVQKDLNQDSGNIEKELIHVKKLIHEEKKNTQEINLKGVSDMNDIKKDIEVLNEKIKQTTIQIQNIEKEKLSTQIEQAQSLMAIKNIHNQYQYNKPKQDQKLLNTKHKFDNTIIFKQQEKNQTTRHKDLEEDTTQDILKMIHWIGEKIHHLQKVKKQFDKKLTEIQEKKLENQQKTIQE